MVISFLGEVDVFHTDRRTEGQAFLEAAFGNHNCFRMSSASFFDRVFERRWGYWRHKLAILAGGARGTVLTWVAEEVAFAGSECQEGHVQSQLVRSLPVDPKTGTAQTLTVLFINSD
jgi:hypothetical protein